MFSQLIEYPKDIADVQKRAMRLDRRIRKTQRLLDARNYEIEQAIADHPELKNDQQRRAKRLEQMQDPEYIALSEAIADATDRKTRLEIDLGQLRNEFSILKLQYRDEIVSKEVAIA
jgi:predicted metalloenzyme YecM